MADSTDERRVLDAVDEYARTHMHPDRPKPSVGEAHIVGAVMEKGSCEGTAASWKPGCYAVFSQNGDLLYIGKASNTNMIGDRLVRFRYKGVSWANPPALVRLITVGEAFEAPSLEEFLINRLQPSYNKHGLGPREV